MFAKLLLPMDSLSDFMDSTAEVQNECMQSSFICINDGCGKRCATNDEGVNPFMKYCNSCNILLHASLDVQINPRPDTDLSTNENVAPSPLEELPEEITLNNYKQEENQSENMSLDEISYALTSLVGTNDKRQQVVIKYGE